MEKRYRKREEQVITAVQLNLDTPGFSYDKWGGKQQCQQGDWIVENNDECYTITAASFADTYTCVGPGRYLKVATVRAEPATSSGQIRTREGSTQYNAGDYIVHNNDDGTDSYAVEKERFERMYQPLD